MMDLKDIADLVSEVARATLPGYRIEKVSVEPSVDSLGNDSLQVTLVLATGRAGRPDGEALITLHDSLWRRLEQAGEARLPIVTALTSDDVTADVDSEP